MPVAALSNTGEMPIAGMFDAGGQGMALRLRSGNTYNTFSKTQLNFSFNGGTGYSHSIKSRHMSSGSAGNDIDFYLWQPGDAIESQGSTHVMSLDGGKVGIGTTTPEYKLDVYAPDGYFKARFQGPDGYITIGPANSGWAHIYTDRPAFIFNQSVYSFPGNFSSFNTSDLTLQTNGTTRMTVRNTDGNVGIGTTSPSTKLSFGTNYAAKMISLYDYTGDWYGLGMGTYQMRLQVGNTNARFSFFAGDATEVMTVKGNGNVGIGSISPNEKLTVNGRIYAKEVKVDVDVPPDYVFEKGYDLLSLSEVRSYIEEHKHLPEVPSGKEMEKEGIDLSRMNMILLKKVEELTLHLISHKQEIEELKKLVAEKKDD
jgi:hypothetical protein